ncbi:glycosyltransferase family 8 protein [Babjeviella inositovora NRRL Y-12698]|uniref:Glycosyltransferase family 8 protein n=1 Tax=Babjeviella inositovora NRRL Y-12698 TaxID=984486 RepID=A0A1E3QI28_9ASCO|nr:glycosyltransferase family 8 protein [Babjeviella inositovora NRRL Y-12698]ODQ77290.1 glycosyltransferase family 8 protein [Babjeviella inositovora NRRL Y-12698]
MPRSWQPKEILWGIHLGVSLSLPHILYSYVYVPLGVIAILAILYGIHQLLTSVIHFVFPASVLALLIHFTGLCFSSRFLGKQRTAKYLKLLDVPAGWALRWINIFFTPSFITLPLSDKVSVKEALTIAGVFVFGYLVMSIVCAYTLVGLQRLTGRSRKDGVVRAEELHRPDDVPLDELPLGSETESGRTSPELDSSSNLFIPSVDETPADSTTDLLPPPKTANSSNPRNPGVGLDQNTSSGICERETYLDMQQKHYRNSSDTTKLVATFITAHFDWFVYGFLFLIGIPIYYVLDYAMPIQLATGVLFFFAALLPPPRFRQFVHPILLSISCCLLVFYILSLMTPKPHHHSFIETIKMYKTGRNYLYLFNPQSFSGKLPGAGDVLTSLMDVSIVALSVPMFTYRGDLRRHAVILIPPLVITICGSFFAYPPLCYQLGISPARSLAFTGRSVTLALGTPLVTSLDGSIPLMAVTTILSGIIGVLTGPLFMKAIRIGKDDYVTRGITLGTNCGAVATAWLMTVDPRAAAMSSISFVLFGVGMVVLGAIPSVAALLALTPTLLNMTVLTDTKITATRVWTTLITNTDYLPGLLALDYSLKRVGSKYPLVALYTDTFTEDGHHELDVRQIPKLRIRYLLPTALKDYTNDVRFYDCWSKLQPFLLVQFDMVVQLDSDMVVLQNMDELFDIELSKNSVFAASHACVCNPYNKSHYPRNWTHDNCAYSDPRTNQVGNSAICVGPLASAGLGICNGGLQVVKPSQETYNKIIQAISKPSKTENYDFADQSLLSDVFNHQWLGLSYVYNALKTLPQIHSEIWDVSKVKNVHYILAPKPWDLASDPMNGTYQGDGTTSENGKWESFVDDTDTFKYWFEINNERVLREREPERRTTGSKHTL